MPTRTRTCQRCHNDYEINRHSSYNASKYCPDCKPIVVLENAKRYRDTNHNGYATAICPVCGQEYRKVTGSKWCPECAPEQRRHRHKVNSAEHRRAAGRYHKGYAPPEECYYLLIRKTVELCWREIQGSGLTDRIPAWWCKTCTVQAWCPYGNREIRGEG